MNKLNIKIFLFVLLGVIITHTEIYTKPLASYKKDSLWYFIDYYGKELFEPKKLHNVIGYSDGYFCVSQIIDGREKWGFLDASGDFALEPQFYKAQLFSDGFALVMEYDYKLGSDVLVKFIDKQGKQLNNDEILDALSFSEGLAYVFTKERRSGYIDKTGQLVLDIKNLIGGKFQGGIAVATDENMNASFINNKGEMIFPNKYESAKNFSEGFAAVCKNSKYDYIDIYGRLKIDGKFDLARDFKEGRAFVGVLFPQSLKSLWGVIDTNGKLLKDMSFTEVWDFSEGLAAVCDSLSWGFVDRNGEFFIKPQYTYCASFVDGLAWASKRNDGIYGYINNKGEFVVKFDKFEKLIDMRLNKRMY